MPMDNTQRVALLVATAAFLISTPALAGNSVTPSEIVREIDLPGVSGELVLTFEDATDLAADSLTIDVQPISLDPCTVCLRLPPNVFIPRRFPVLITIEPDVDGLSFRGRWSLELVTDDLTFNSDTPLRLFRSPSNVAPFEDITRSVGFGSFRVAGIGGSFSQFVLATDQRGRGLVVIAKLNRFQAILDDPKNGIDPLVLATLQTLFEQVETDLANGDLPAARKAIDDLRDAVVANSGKGVPDIWDPPMTPVSIAGQLRGLLRSLRFSVAANDPSQQAGSNSIERTLNPGPGLSLDVTLRFAGGFDIDLADPGGLGLSAQVIDPADFVARLPEGVSVPEEFPVLLTIEPASEQSFSGSYSIELSTPNLGFTGASPFRLFKAEVQGPFEDQSSTIGVGSFRVAGIGGSFSEFLIVEDQRPVEDVVNAKFDELEAFLVKNAKNVPQEVIDLAVQARDAFAQGDTAGAIQGIDDFVAEIFQSRETIPGIWRPDGSLVNVFGELLMFARTIRFSLVLDQTPLGGDPFDVNNDGSVDPADVFLLIDRVFGNGTPLQE